MHIDSYSFGKIVIGGETYSSDLIVFPQRVVPDWWRSQGHALCLEDLQEILEYKPEVLIIGKGAFSCMKVSPEIKDKLLKQGIDTFDQNTKEACKFFNEQMNSGKKVAGAFHLTC